MFAHSLTRRGWQKADNHNEQICSCKVDPTEGNCGLFVGGAVTTWAPAFTTVIFLSRVCTHSGDRCCSPRLYCSFYFGPPESNKPCSHSPTESLSCPGWRGRGLPSVMQNISELNNGSLKKRKKHTDVL